MESAQLSFTQALEYLSEIQKRINEVRLLNESTCHDITQLLKKPWPNKSSTASSSVTGTAEGSRGPDRSKEDNVFSTEEQSMLAEVDSVLAQAQKLRQFQSKVKIKQTSNSNQDKIPLKAASATNGAELHNSAEIPEPPLGSDQHPDHPDQDNPINHIANNSEGDAASDVAIISARDLERLLKKELPSSKEQTSKLSRPTSGSNITSNPTKLKKTASSAVGSSRPVGSGRSASRKDAKLKTSSAEIGRHVSKPASRFGETQSRYKQSAKAKTSSKDKTKQISQENGTQTNTRQRLVQVQAKPASSSSKQTANEVTRLPPGDVKNEHHSRTQRSTDTVEVDRVTQSISQLEVSKAHETRTPGTQQETKTLPSKQADPPAPQPEKIPFMLRRDGSSLTIPTKLKKQYQNNAKLRDKLTSMIHGDVSHHSDHFLDLFGDNPSSKLPLDAELQRLIAEYQYLIQLTTDVRKQLQAIHGKTQWEDVYYLQTMSMAIRQRQEEMRKQFNELKESLNNSTDVTVSRSTHKSTNGSPFLWHQADEFKDECLSLHGGNILQYSSRAELLKWNELVYQIQLIQQEKIIQEVSGDAILELLSRIDYEDPSYPTLYRIAHGLILNAGNVYPSMISDEERAITPRPGY